METKEQLKNSIKEWVKIDNEIRALNEELVKRKKEKKERSSELMNIMKKNEIDCFDIKNGQIVYCKKNIKKPITKKMLMDVLSKYYQGDVTKATDVNNFILDNREEVVKESIIHKISKD